MVTEEEEKVVEEVTGVCASLSGQVFVPDACHHAIIGTYDWTPGIEVLASTSPPHLCLTQVSPKITHLRAVSQVGPASQAQNIE